MRWVKIEPGHYEAENRRGQFRVIRRNRDWFASFMPATGCMAHKVEGSPFTTKFAATDRCEQVAIRWHIEDREAAR